MTLALPCFLGRNLSQIGISIERKSGHCTHGSASAAACRLGERSIHPHMAGRGRGVNVVTGGKS